MPKDNENFRFPFLEPVEPSEPVGFAVELMIRCEECLRANPPTRVNCLYCAAALPLTESSERLRKPSLRPPDKHEQGYNIIILPDEQIGKLTDCLKEAANWLKLSTESLEHIISKSLPLPLARTASEEEANLAPDKLRALGLNSVTLSDDQLGRVESCVTKIRAMFFDGDKVQVVTSVAGDTAEFDWSDVTLIVSGRLVTRRVDVTERKSRKEEKEIVDTSQYFDDEAVIDYYTASDSRTWRIGANGFDFSCLADQKTLLATENIATLRKLMIERSTNASFDDAYHSLRKTIAIVWGTEQETQSQGWKRERPGRYSLGASTIDSNESQFTRYSRLKFYFNKNR